MKKLWRNRISILLIILLLITTVGCSKTSSKTTSTETDSKTNNVTKNTEIDTNLTQLKIDTVTPVKLELENYDGSFYTVKKPKGWIIETTGEYETFGFRMYDKEAPERQVFYYGSMSPILKSAQAKDFWKQYINNSGFPQAKLYSDAPVLSPATSEQFFTIFNEFTTLAKQYGINHNFSSLEEFKGLENMQRNSPMASVALDDSIIMGLFKQNGVPCEGLFGATLVDSIQYPVNDFDTGFYTMYVVTGVSAPTDEFSSLQSTLTEVIGSFKFSQSYINEGVQKNIWETNAALQVGKTLSEASDSYNKAWHDRQKTTDASAQKYGDSLLGYDRVYDTETGETYRAEYGFWEEYENNREKFANKNLQMVPSNGYDLLNKPVNGYITK